MIVIDGAKLDIVPVEFTYDLPKPFGPNRGEAYLKIWAKPVSNQNSSLQEKMDNLLRKTKAKDMIRKKRFEKNNNADAFVEANERDIKYAVRKASEILYDECIERWETNIQSNGENIEPTKENFILLEEFNHPVLTDLFEQMRKDLNDENSWLAEAEKEELEKDVGN